MEKDSIYRKTIIHHPDGDCTLGEIQKDVIAWRNMQGDNTFGFTSKTVQALIDTIISLKENTVTKCLKMQHDYPEYVKKSYYTPNLREIAEWTKKWIKENL